MWKPRLDNDNPGRFWEPLPAGPDRGKALDRASFDASRLEYYNVAGWTEDGVPKPETLRRLGLDDVEAKLNETGLLF
jgi:aldehyde:ferredoxin oxidoreductase